MLYSSSMYISTDNSNLFTLLEAYSFLFRKLKIYLNQNRWALKSSIHTFINGQKTKVHTSPQKMWTNRFDQVEMVRKRYTANDLLYKLNVVYWKFTSALHNRTKRFSYTISAITCLLCSPWRLLFLSLSPHLFLYILIDFIVWNFFQCCCKLRQIVERSFFSHFAYVCI